MLYIDDNHRGCVGLKVKYAWYSDGAWILMNEYVIWKDWRGKEFFIWYVGNMWLDTKVTLMGAVKRVIFIDSFLKMYHRQNIYKDGACSVWNSSISKYEILFVFC